MLILGYTRFDLCGFVEMNIQLRGIKLLVEIGCSVAVATSFVCEKRRLVELSRVRVWFVY